MQLVVLLRDFKCEILHVHLEKLPPEAFSDGLVKNQSASHRLKLKTIISLIKTKVELMGFMSLLILSKIRLLVLCSFYFSFFKGGRNEMSDAQLLDVAGGILLNLLLKDIFPFQIFEESFHFCIKCIPVPLLFFPPLSHFPFCVLISCRSLAHGQGWNLGTA